jgi:hypothetical protein
MDNVKKQAILNDDENNNDYNKSQVANDLITLTQSREEDIPRLGIIFIMEDF